MKTLPMLALTMGVMLVSGCATKNGVALDTVGPAPSQLTGNPTKGTLMVYSAYETSADFTMRDPDRQEYSDYKILSSDGEVAQRVTITRAPIFKPRFP